MSTTTHPPHSTGGVEVVDIIEQWRLGFCLGTAVKYVMRHEHKDTMLTDYEKARWYIQRVLDRMLADDTAVQILDDEFFPIEPTSPSFIYSTWDLQVEERMFIESLWGYVNANGDAERRGYLVTCRALIDTMIERYMCE